MRAEEKRRTETKQKQALRLVALLGREILQSDGLRQEKIFIQHGTVSVYTHSLAVAVLCVRIAALLPLRFDTASLVRGALLHDYFLYDWHIPDRSHRWHGFTHARRALQNARRDFSLNAVEQNMIGSHMFPLNPTLPRYRESVLLCLADKLCAVKETVSGRF